MAYTNISTSSGSQTTTTTTAASYSWNKVAAGVERPIRGHIVDVGMGRREEHSRTKDEQVDFEIEWLLPKPGSHFSSPLWRGTG